MKDNFSSQAAEYARFRPSYPPELIRALAALAPAHRTAWDCATGNGQVALLLAEHFDRVWATDISAQQLAQAPAHPRIYYAQEPAERCSAPDGLFDLIVVAQAVHWFDFETFYAEARRLLAPGGVLALVGYGLFQTGTPALDAVIGHFYREVIGPYWDAERRYIDEGYRSLPFPWEEITLPGDYRMQYKWTLEMLAGYLQTWSAVQHVQRAKGYNPVAALIPALREVWGDGDWQTIAFPLLLRIGKSSGQG